MAPRKGRLDTILLSDLFQNLAESQANGLLTVRNDEDTKTVLLDRGQISITSAGMSEKVMLGDLLLARGLVSEADIEKALEMQKSEHKRLGELLIQMAVVTQANIDEAIRFQIEEEILDLFTWRKGEFEFNDAVTEAEKAGLLTQGTTFQLDIKKIINQSATRAEEWRQHEQRITSPYLVFRPTEKALSPAVQKEIGENALKKRIFKWVQENRTVDTIVRKSCIGRNPLYQLLIAWIEERNVELVPVGELKFLASEHRSRHRYFDAMGIYRRLKDAARTEAEKRELEGAIGDTKAAMQAQQAAAQGLAAANQTASMAHVKRAQQQRRSRILQKVTIYGSVGLLVLGLIFWAALQVGADHTEEYDAALADLDATIRVQTETGQYAAAVASCNQLLERYPNLADRITERIDGIERGRRNLANKKREEIRGQLGRLDIVDIKNRLNQLAETFKDLPGYVDQIKKDHAELDREIVVRTEILHANSLHKWLLMAALWQEQGNFPQARFAYFRAQSLATEKDPERGRIAEQLLAMEKVETAQREALAAACALDLAGEDLNAALVRYRAVAAMTPRMAWGAEAETRATILDQEITAAARQVQTVLNLPSDTETASVERQFRQAVIQVAPQSALLEEVRRKLSVMIARRQEMDGLIKDAQNQDAGNRPDVARQKWSDLMQRYKDELVRRKLTIPYTVQTNPPGAQVYAGNDLLGLTPLTFRLPAEDQRPIEARLPGFSSRRLTPDERRKLFADLTLAIDPIWTVRLTQGDCHGLHFLNNDLLVVAGGSLLGLRPSTKTAVFDPQEIIKLPPGDRKREAINAPAELKPPAWWALQHLPAIGASRETVWLPVQDGRLVRISLTDLQTAEVMAPIEAATPLTLYKNPFVKNAETALFVGLDGQLYSAELSDLTQIPQPAGKLKYLPFPVRMAGEEVAFAVDDAGALVRLPIGDFDNAKATPLSQPITGGIQIASLTGPGGDTVYRAFAVETDGALELIDLADNTKIWTQAATAFSVRALRLIGSGESFLQTGLTQGRSVLELRTTADGPNANPVWSVAIEGTALKPCVSATAVYVATDDKTLRAFNLKDGKLLWSSPIPGLPEYMEAQTDGTVAVAVKQGADRSVLIYKVEQSAETPAP